MSKIEQYSVQFNLMNETELMMHLLELGKTISPTLSERTRENKFKFCISPIWIDVVLEDGRVQIYYDSDGVIAKGVCHVITDCFNGLTLADASKIHKDNFKYFGIEEIMRRNARNGLCGLVDHIIDKVSKL